MTNTYLTMVIRVADGEIYFLDTGTRGPLYNIHESVEYNIAIFLAVPSPHNNLESPSPLPRAAVSLSTIRIPYPIESWIDVTYLVRNRAKLERKRTMRLEAGSNTRKLTTG